GTCRSRARSPCDHLESLEGPAHARYDAVVIPGSGRIQRITVVRIIERNHEREVLDDFTARADVEFGADPSPVAEVRIHRAGQRDVRLRVVIAEGRVLEREESFQVVRASTQPHAMTTRRRTPR